MAIKEQMKQDIHTICEWKSVEIEGKDGNPTVQKSSRIEEEAIFGESFLGERILCQYSWH